MKKRITKIPKGREKVFKDVLSLSKKNENAILYNLGVGLEYEYAPKGYGFKADYFRIGKEFWRAIEIELYNIFCDLSRRKPKAWVHELLSGDIRAFIIGLSTAITSSYNVGWGIVVPAVALVVKRGMTRFCKRSPIRKSKRSVLKILSEKKVEMEDLRKSHRQEIKESIELLRKQIRKLEKEYNI